MKAMILAAGFGTRLRPITDKLPKALVEVKGKTMLERVIHRLVNIGIDCVVINAHHFSDQIHRFVQSHNWGIPVDVVVEEEPGFETAGGVANAAYLLEDDEPVLLHNVDVLSSIDLTLMEQFHGVRHPFATLAVRTPATNRPFLVNNEGAVVGYLNKTKDEKVLMTSDPVVQEVRFCGIHIASQAMLRQLSDNPNHWVGKSLTDYYLSILSGKVIRAFDTSDSFWLDIGTPEKLSIANSLQQNIDFLS